MVFQWCFIENQKGAIAIDFIIIIIIINIIDLAICWSVRVEKS